MTSQKPTIVLLDDEERIVRSVKAILRQQYKVRATTNPQEALAWLKTEQVMLIISDQRMPDMDGVEVLKRARKISPGTMRILLTGYADKEAVIGSVNEGEIFRYIHKPWQAAELQATVDEAVAVAQSTYTLLDDHSKTLNGVDPVGHSSAAPIKVLVLDDHAQDVAESIVCDKGFEIYCADTLDQAYERLSEQPIGVMLTDVRVDGEDITNTIRLLKVNHPDLITIAMTHYHDSDSLIHLINDGQVFRFLMKPLGQGKLKRVLKAAKDRIKLNAISPKLLERTKVKPITVEPKSKKRLSLMARIRKIRNHNAA